MRSSIIVTSLVVLASALTQATMSSLSELSPSVIGGRSFPTSSGPDQVSFRRLRAMRSVCKAISSRDGGDESERIERDRTALTELLEGASKAFRQRRRQKDWDDFRARYETDRIDAALARYNASDSPPISSLRIASPIVNWPVADQFHEQIAELRKLLTVTCLKLEMRSGVSMSNAKQILERFVLELGDYLYLGTTVSVLNESEELHLRAFEKALFKALDSIDVIRTTHSGMRSIYRPHIYYRLVLLMYAVLYHERS